MRSAGCIINDIVDREFDRQVERTKLRPLASGEVSLKEAFQVLAALGAISLAVLISLPKSVFLIGLCSVPLVILYPFAKRITYLPQLVLGFTFNYGVLLGYAAVKKEIASEAFILYAALVFWTLAYDTIYAHQDKNDDIKIGVKSTALLLGNKTKFWLAIFFAALIALYLTAHSSLYSLIAACLASAHAFWQVKTLDINNPANCLFRFKSNVILGFILFLGIFF